MEDIVEQLKEERIRRGISLGGLSKLMGTERARLSEIENGHGGLTLKRLYQWANALGMNVKIELN